MLAYFTWFYTNECKTPITLPIFMPTCNWITYDWPLMNNFCNITTLQSAVMRFETLKIGQNFMLRNMKGFAEIVTCIAT